MQGNEAIPATPIPMTNGSGGEDTSRPSPVMMPNSANALAVSNTTSTSPPVSSSSSSGSNSLPTPTGASSTVITPGLPAPSAPYLTITNPAMTAAVLSQQPLIIPTGAQFLTIPVSLATLPGSNQIPVFATSTGQLVLANLASVPTPGSSYNASNHGANSTSPFSVNPSPFVTQAGQLSRPPPGIPGMPGISIHPGNQSSLTSSALSVTSARGMGEGHEVDIDRDEVKAECANSEEVEEEVEDEEEDEEGAHSSSPASISENKICNILNDTGSGDEALSHEDHIALATRRAAVGNDNGGKVVVDGIDLEEIREFARQFKIRRLSLGLTQSQVGQALTAAEGPAYSQSAICRFEKLDITPKSAQKIKPVLEKWMREAEQRYQEGLRETGTSNLASDLTKKRKRRTSFTPQALDVLNAHFDKNTHPSGAEMTALAEQLKYDREVVRVWFCNKRQALKNTIKRLKTDRQFQQTTVTAATTLPLSRQHPHSSPLPPPPVSQQLQLQSKQQPPLPSPLSQQRPQQLQQQPQLQQQQQQQLQHRLQQHRQPLPQLQLQLPTPSSLANRVLSQSGGGLCNIPFDELKMKLAKVEPTSPLPCDLTPDPVGLASAITAISNQHLNHEPDSSIANEACSLTTKVEADPV